MGPLRPMWCLILFLVLSPLMGSIAFADDKPQLDWDKPVWCVVNEKNEKLRIQCTDQEDGTTVCLVAPDTMAKSVGGGTLKKTKYCQTKGRKDYDKLLASGIQMVPAIAETPPGWARDDKGRVFQMTFDLFRRFHLGVGWAPTFDPTGDLPSSLDLVGLDMGLMGSFLDVWDKSRHTITAFDGSLVLDSLELEAMLFSYDLSRMSDKPFLRIVSFIGPPKRFDLYMDMGWGLELLDLHLHPHKVDHLVELEFGEVHAGWDIWQSADLYNHVRLRLGIGIGAMWDTAEETAYYFASPNLGLELRFGLDQDGFHYLTADASYEIRPIISGTSKKDMYTTTGGSLAYEVIFLSFNDQPLSLRLEAGADWRDDLPDEVAALDLTAMASLRFSFWAPTKLQKKIDSVRYE